MPSLPQETSDHRGQTMRQLPRPLGPGQLRVRASASGLEGRLQANLVVLGKQQQQLRTDCANLPPSPSTLLPLNQHWLHSHQRKNISGANSFFSKHIFMTPLGTSLSTSARISGMCRTHSHAVPHTPH